MKKYISLSALFYVIAAVLFLALSQDFILKYPFLDITVMVVSSVLTLIGISFGVKSVNTKESGWLVRVLIIIGVLMIIFVLGLLMLGRISS